MSQPEFSQFIEDLKESKIDYLLLSYLTLPECIIRRYPTLTQLMDLCQSRGISTDSIHRQLSTYVNSHGIQPVCPKNFIVARKREEVVDMYDSVKASWPLHIPFVFQTFGPNMRNMFFVLCSSPQDAVIRMNDILEQGSIVFRKSSYSVCGIIEQVLDNHALVRQIFDCETMVSQFHGVLTLKELREAIHCLPEVLYQQFVERSLIAEETFATFDVKDRSRPVNKKGRDDYKVSAHILSNIVASKKDHETAMRMLVHGNRELLERDKSKQVVTKELFEKLSPFQRSLLFIDPAALPGAANGITSMLSRKGESDPFPTYVKRVEGCLGTVISSSACPVPEPHGLFSEHVTRQQRLWWLCNLSLTIPPFDAYIITYQGLEKLRGREPLVPPAQAGAELWEGALTGAKCQGTKSQALCPRPLASSSSSCPVCLPSWFQSELARVSSGNLRVFNKKEPKHLSKLPEWARNRLLGLLHVAPCYCAKSMAEGVRRVHNSNGTYVAVLENSDKKTTLLLSCPSKEHRIVINKLPEVIKIIRKIKGGAAQDAFEDSVEPVKETDFSQSFNEFLWIMIEGEEAFRAMLGRLSNAEPGECGNVVILRLSNLVTW